MENETKKNRMFQTLSQWVFLPIITFLVGIVGTYAIEVKRISEVQVVNTDHIASNSKEIDNERTERRSEDVSTRSIAEERMRNVTALMQELVRQNTELISLIKVQQQIGKP